jgi:small ligand-binding sensory domain FIST
MKFASQSSMLTDTQAALDQMWSALTVGWSGVPDLALVFATPHYEDDLEQLRKTLRDRGVRHVLGCTGEGILDSTREHERLPGIVLMIGELPGVEIRPFSIDQAELEAGEMPLFDDLAGREQDLLVLLADPFELDVPGVLEYGNEHVPGIPIIGGLASGGEAPGQNVLISTDECRRRGAVGVHLSGRLRVDTVVSQGCRPIGQHAVVTKADGPVLLELGGRPAMEALKELAASIPAEDLELARRGLMLGRVVSEYRERFGRGDFLVRNILGLDQASGAIAVGDHLRPGTTVQFHVRDAASADEDLRQMLAPHAVQSTGAPPAGALLFTCNGRGTRMWDQPNHDVAALQAQCGPVPTAGFFCAGELGPIGQSNFLHGHTASLALIREP